MCKSEYYNILFCKYNNKFLETYNKQAFKYNLRTKLSQINSIEDCIHILQLFETIDEMCDNIINIFHKFHPNDNELQNISLLFQKYQHFIDNKGYAANTLWFCVIMWIDEFENIRKINNINSVVIEDDNTI
tara:strand:- start:501 stop:893 length:393 start_codon:yes stop_codon:yes gene_type:complete